MFTAEQINQFLNDAPNDQYLVCKCALIIGIYGLLRVSELNAFMWSDIEFANDKLICQVYRHKQRSTKRRFRFVVDGPGVAIVRKYMEYHDEELLGETKFLKYLRKTRSSKNGDFQVTGNVGHNMIAKYPEVIASFLGIDNLKTFTSHSFRRTGATLLAETGVSVTTLQSAGGWSGPTSAMMYVEQSMNAINRIEDQFRNRTNCQCGSL